MSNAKRECHLEFRESFVRIEHIRMLCDKVIGCPGVSVETAQTLKETFESLEQSFLAAEHFEIVDPQPGVGTALVFRSSEVNVWEMEYKAGQSSTVHEHFYPYAFLILEGRQSGYG